MDKEPVHAGVEIPDDAIKLLEKPAFITVYVGGKLCQRNNNSDIECSDDPAKIAQRGQEVLLVALARKLNKAQHNTS